MSNRNDSESSRKFYIGLLLLISIILVPFFLMKSTLYIISTPSMAPTINIGDIIIKGDKTPEDINAGSDNGDILIIKGAQYYYEQGFDPFFWNNLDGDIPIIHRAIDKKKIGEKWYFLTKGDNNWVADGGMLFINETDDYILIEYNSSAAIYVSETEILGVVLGIIPYLGYLNIFFPVILVTLICVSIPIVVLKRLNYKVLVVKKDKKE